MVQPPSQADRDRRRDILTGNLRRTLFLLALPVLMQQFLNTCVGFVDTYLSGQISSEATSAVGLAAYIGWLAGLLFSLVGTGTTALVSRHWGAGEFETANRITNRSVSLATLLGAGVYALIYFGAPGLATLLDMHGEARQTVVRYLRFDGIGHLFTSLSLIGAAALRGAGDMRTPMVILGLVSVVNVIVSAALVFGIGPVPLWAGAALHVAPMGIDGIVIGTVVARFSGGMLLLGVLLRGVSGLHVVRHELLIRGEIVRRILRIGAPAALDGAVMWAGHFLFLMIIARLETGGLGSAIFAAHIVGIRVEAITYLPAVAWGVASATMIGQSLGAQDRPRAVQSAHEAVGQCSLVACCISIGFLVGAGPIYQVMHGDAAVREAGIPAFRMLALFQVPLAISIIYTYGLRGAGDTRYPLLFNVLGVFGLRLPLAWLCGVVLEGGLLGAWIGMCTDVAVRAGLVWARFRWGRWAETRV